MWLLFLVLSFSLILSVSVASAYFYVSPTYVQKGNPVYAYESYYFYSSDNCLKTQACVREEGGSWYCRTDYDGKGQVSYPKYFYPTYSKNIYGKAECYKKPYWWAWWYQWVNYENRNQWVNVYCPSGPTGNYKCGSLWNADKRYAEWRNSDCSTWWNYVENCDNDYYYCSTGNRVYYHNGYCSSGYCTSSNSYVKDCDDYDYWTCSGDTKYKKDYYCSGGGCASQNTNYFNCNNNNYYGDWQYYCSGTTVRKHRLFYDYGCSNGNCYVASTYWKDDQYVENCDSKDGWYCEGGYSKYRDYYCSSGGCSYTITQSNYCPYGCDTNTGVCVNKYLTIKSVNIFSESNLNENVTVRVYYESSFSGYVDFAVDYIRGSVSTGNCYKLHCANPAGDTECNQGCEGGSLKTVYVPFGSGYVEFTIHLPAAKGKINGPYDDFIVKVGAWKTPYTEYYDMYTASITPRVYCHVAPLGGEDWAYDNCPAAKDEGDCDDNNECQPGLICVDNVGSNYGWNWDVDVCQPNCEDLNGCVDSSTRRDNAYYDYNTLSCKYDTYTAEDYWTCYGDGNTKIFIDYYDCQNNEFLWRISEEYNCDKLNSVIEDKIICKYGDEYRYVLRSDYACSNGECYLADTPVEETFVRDCGISGWECSSDLSTRYYTQRYCDETQGGCTSEITQTENCVFGCDVDTATCNGIDLTNVDSDSQERLGSILNISVDLDSYNIDDEVIFVVDLVKGDYPNCEKLFCGDPSSDTECGIGGCMFGDNLPPTRVVPGANKVDLSILLPVNGTSGNYKLIVSAYKPQESNPNEPDYSRQYDSIEGGIVEVINVCDGVICPNKCDGDTIYYNGYCDETNGDCIYEISNCSDMDGWICNGNLTEERDYYCFAGNCEYDIIQQENCTFGCYEPTAECKGITIESANFVPSEVYPNSNIELQMRYKSIGIFGNVTFGVDIRNETNNATAFSQMFELNTTHGINTFTITIPIYETVQPMMYNTRVTAWRLPYSIMYDSVSNNFIIVYENGTVTKVGFFPVVGGENSVVKNRKVSLIAIATGAIVATAVAGVYISKTKSSSNLNSSIRKLSKSFDKIEKVIYREERKRYSLKEVLSNIKSTFVAPINIISERGREAPPRPELPEVKPIYVESKSILPSGISKGQYVGSGYALPPSYYEGQKEWQNILQREEQEELQRFQEILGSLKAQDLANISESERMLLFSQAQRFGFLDAAAIFGNRESLNNYVQTILPPPPVQVHSIEDESWWSKVGRGWGASLGETWNGITNFFGSAADFIGNTIENGIQAIKEDPSNLLYLTPFGGIKYAWDNRESINNGIKSFLDHPLESLTSIGTGIVKGINAIGNGIVNLGKMYVDALINNPIDTLAKTAMTVGGLLIAGAGIILSLTGIGSIAGVPLTAIGAGMVAAGMTTIIIQNSYEYATAETEEQLMERAKANSDDNLWLAFGALDLAMYGITLRTAGTAIKIAGKTDDGVAIIKAGSKIEYVDEVTGVTKTIKLSKDTPIDELASALGKSKEDLLTFGKSTTSVNIARVNKLRGILDLSDDQLVRLVDYLNKFSPTKVDDYLDLIVKYRTTKGSNKIIERIISSKGNIGNIKGAINELLNAEKLSQKGFKIVEFGKTIKTAKAGTVDIDIIAKIGTRTTFIESKSIAPPLNKLATQINKYLVAAKHGEDVIFMGDKAGKLFNDAKYINLFLNKGFKIHYLEDGTKVWKYVGKTASGFSATGGGGLKAFDSMASSNFVSKFPKETLEIQKLAKGLDAKIIIKDISKDEIKIVKSLLKNAKSAEEASSELRRMGYLGKKVDLISFERIDEPAVGMWSALSKDSAKVRFDVSKALGKNSDEIFELAHHEYLHSFTNELDDAIISKLPNFVKKGDINSLIARNEAHDLLTLRFTEKASKTKGLISKNGYLQRLEKWDSIKIVKEITSSRSVSKEFIKSELKVLNNILKGNTGLPQTSFLSEWIALNGKSGMNTLLQLEKIAADIGDPVLFRELTETLKEVKLLSNSFKEVMKLV